jgi:hypothetical protein
MKIRNLLALLALSSTAAVAHPGHDHSTEAGDHNEPFVESNWGGLFFRNADEYVLPDDAALKAYLVKNHGGSDVDPSTSDLYTTIGAKVIRFTVEPGAGVILEDSEKFGEGNFHGLALENGGKNPSFYFADNERHLVRHRAYPDSDVSDYKAGGSVDKYFADGGSFNPTDVELHPESGDAWVFDGYGSSLVFDTKNPKSIFGGKSLFNTSHGGAFHNGNWVVCSRGSGEICTVNPEGEIIERFLISKGNMPCDIDFLGDYALVGCLQGPGSNEKGYPGAPCYIYHWPSKQIVSTIVPKSDFGLELGNHIHNAAWWPQVVDGKVAKLFIAFSFWNPGDFHVVEVSGLPLAWLPAGE